MFYVPNFCFLSISSFFFFFLIQCRAPGKYRNPLFKNTEILEKKFLGEQEVRMQTLSDCHTRLLVMRFIYYLSYCFLFSKIIDLGFNEKFIRTWEYYFDYLAAGHKSRTLGNYQVCCCYWSPKTCNCSPYNVLHN